MPYQKIQGSCISCNSRFPIAIDDLDDYMKCPHCRGDASITVICPHCGQNINTNGRSISCSIPCPSCETEFICNTVKATDGGSIVISMTGRVEMHDLAALIPVMHQQLDEIESLPLVELEEVDESYIPAKGEPVSKVILNLGHPDEVSYFRNKVGQKVAGAKVIAFYDNRGCTLVVGCLNDKVINTKRFTSENAYRSFRNNSRLLPAAAFAKRGVKSTESLLTKSDVPKSSSQDALGREKPMKIESAVFCQACGRPIAENLRFCAACNERTEAMSVKHLEQTARNTNRAYWIGLIGGSIIAGLSAKALNASGIHLGFVPAVVLWLASCWTIKKIAEKI